MEREQNEEGSLFLVEKYLERGYYSLVEIDSLLVEYRENYNKSNNKIVNYLKSLIPSDYSRFCDLILNREKYVDKNKKSGWVSSV